MPKRDNLNRVRSKNRQMWEAWEQGRELLEQLGKSAEWGGMRAVAGKSDSVAERFRKYRRMAARITEDELASICESCVAKRRAWGPSFLVELSRVARGRKRRSLVEEALGERWSLSELKRRVRDHVGPRRPHVRTGRKREVDRTDEAAILAELLQLARSWMRFEAELGEDAETLDEIAGLAVLTRTVRQRFQQACDSLRDLQSSVETRLRRLRSP